MSPNRIFIVNNDAGSIFVCGPLRHYFQLFFLDKHMFFFWAEAEY